MPCLSFVNSRSRLANPINNDRQSKVKASIKAGGANLFNHRYIQYAGGPTIGGLYYVAITIDGLLK